MRKQLLSAVMVIILGLFIHPAAQARIRPSVIYGDDNRLDYYQVQDPTTRSHADATVALIRASSLTPVGLATNIRSTAYGSSMGLCSTEPFYEQETAAFCSGFLVTPDTVVTAGHCVRNQVSCDATRFVFGFRFDQAHAQPRSVPNEYVFACRQLVHSVVSPGAEDFAVIKLDRPVQHVKPLSLRRRGSPSAGEPLVVMGYPVGLPLKIAAGAQVRRVAAEYLVANLDTYGGNSGSAVLNAISGDVEGILVRGEMDFIYQNGCRVSNQCDAAGCRGEDVTLIERVLNHL